MGQVTVGNIPDEQFVALKQVAAENNRSAEAEVRFAILKLVRDRLGVGFADVMHREFGGAIDDDYEFPRGKAESKPMDFK